MTCQTQDISGLVHPNLLSQGIPNKIKRESLGKGKHRIPSLNKNKYRQDGTSHRQAQSCHTNNPPSKVLTGSTLPPSEEGKEVGTTMTPVLAHKISPPLDKDPPMRRR